MRKYPTKEIIMEEEQKFKPEVIKLIKDWNKKYWKENKIKGTKAKFFSLKVLAMSLAKIYNKPLNIEFQENLSTCCYVPEKQTIFINETTSIITLLHEFAHHIFGADETKACKWSVWLFKKTFPISFTKLKWEGHMLKK